MKRQLSTVLGVLGVLAVLAGCGVMDSVKEKSVNAQIGIYGMEVTASDAAANGSPTGKIGFGTVDYHSVPMEKGQPYYAVRTTNSIWTDSPASETKIWIGRASEKAVLTFEAVPDTMIKICGDGTISSGSATVTVTPTADSGTGVPPVSSEK